MFTRTKCEAFRRKLPFRPDKLRTLDAVGVRFALGRREINIWSFTSIAAETHYSQIVKNSDELGVDRNP